MTRSSKAGRGGGRPRPPWVTVATMRRVRGLWGTPAAKALDIRNARDLAAQLEADGYPPPPGGWAGHHVLVVLDWAMRGGR